MIWTCRTKVSLCARHMRWELCCFGWGKKAAVPGREMRGTNLTGKVLKKIDRASDQGPDSSQGGQDASSLFVDIFGGVCCGQSLV